jgi:hypothetical protein
MEAEICRVGYMDISLRYPANGNLTVIHRAKAVLSAICKNVRPLPDRHI